MNAFEKVINVNPVQQPVGALNPEVAMGAIRRRVYAQSTDIARRKSGRMLRRIFGPTSLNSTLSIYLLIFRLAFGVWMLVEATSGMLAGGINIPSIAMIIAGMAVAFGCATRMVSATGTLVTLYVTFSAISEGIAPGILGILAIAFSFFAIAGPGRYSIDSILRHNIFRSIRRRQMSRLLANRFSYRAYEFAHIG